MDNKCPLVIAFKALDLPVSYSANLNLNENCLDSNTINFLDFKIVLNSSRSLDICVIIVKILL